MLRKEIVVTYAFDVKGYVKFFWLRFISHPSTVILSVRHFKISEYLLSLNYDTLRGIDPSA